MTNDQRPVAWKEIVSAQYRGALALVCGGVWLHAADALVVATMMPSIVADIGGTNLIHWSVALYEVGSIIVAAAGGLLALRYGIHLPMAVAATVFALGCLFSAIAHEMWLLLAGRLIQGMGGGGLFALSFVAVNRLFPRRLMARVLGGVSTLWATSALLGPMIGGLFVQYSNWRIGFAFFAGQALLMAFLIYSQNDIKAFAPVQKVTEKFPVVRLAWLCTGIVMIAYAGQDVSWLRTTISGSGGLICLAIFLQRDRNSRDSRLLPLRSLSFYDPVGSAMIVVLCFAASTIALTLYGPLLITRLHGVNELTVGMIMAAEAVTWNLVAIAVSGRSERHDRFMICAGMLTVTASIIGFVFCVATGPLWLITACALLQGAGFGLSWTFILRRATLLASESENARVAGAIPTLQRVGYALGASYLALFANGSGLNRGNTIDMALPHQLSETAYWVFSSCLPLAIIGLFAMYRFLRDPVSSEGTTNDRQE
ncbi:MAG: MFS transporter [Granulosicoccus sp.]